MGKYAAFVKKCLINAQKNINLVIICSNEATERKETGMKNAYGIKNDYIVVGDRRDAEKLGVRQWSRISVEDAPAYLVERQRRYERSLEMTDREAMRSRIDSETRTAEAMRERVAAGMLPF